MSAVLIALPSDQSERERLRDVLDQTLYVEAGAGTGKTTELVNRIIALVGTKGLRLERLAAITFTEAAAAELKERVRRELEKAAADPERSDVERGRLDRAALDVDLASIQTIHAFAGSLLRTYPIEAGLPPGFATWDEIQARLDFEERFRRWLYDEVVLDDPESRPRQDALRRALLLGMTFDQLRQLAVGLQGQSDLLESVTWQPEDPASALAVAHDLGPAILALAGWIPLARNGENDPLVRQIRRLGMVAQRLADARDEEDALAAFLEVGAINTQAGNKNDWNAARGQPNPATEIKNTFREAKDAIAETIAAHRRAALVAVLGYVRAFALTYAGERRREGAATFQDLLTWARDLLRDNLDARRRAQEQYDYVFVDEFQDTDPLQAEIVWFLTANPADEAGPHWRKATPAPGKLFVVGDPKQSIYRFRRADIGLYGQIYGGAADDQKPRLTENFRSAPDIIRWINHQFVRDMREEAGVQAPYVELSPHVSDDGNGGVYRIGGPIDGNAAEIRAGEAEAVAVTARLAVEGEWLVREGKKRRPARYRDVCVLLPTRSNVRRIEDALERHGVPYRVEGGSLVLNTPEVRDLLSCLRAIDDPSDQVALVATLRSPAFACSDLDLLEWVECGGALDYSVERSDSIGPVAEAMQSLRSLHAGRADRSTAATIDAFVRERMLAIQAFGQPRPREAWRRLRYVVAQAGRLAAVGRPGLRALVDWLDDLGRAQFRDLESPLPEADEDAVRLMTVHAAKGLEFPIVIMTGLGSKRGGPPGSVRVIPDRQDLEIPTIEVRVGQFETDGFAMTSDHERRLDDAEQIRLDYVAATRARDHLVLCVHHAKPNLPASRILKNLEEADAPPCRELPLGGLDPPAPPPVRTIAEPHSPDDHARREREWSAARQAAIDRAASARFVTPSLLGDEAMVLATGSNGASHSTRKAGRPAGVENGESASLLYDDEVESDDDADLEAAPSARKRDEPALLGQAVHAALVEIDRGKSVAAAAYAAARANGIRNLADQIIALVEATRAFPTYRAAVAAPRHWFEVPVGVEIDGVLLEGRIDLLWECPDGTLGIVDVKTDQVDRAAAFTRAESYRFQVGAYALAIQEATHHPVSRVEILFAALGDLVVECPDVDGLLRDVRGAIARAR